MITRPTQLPEVRADVIRWISRHGPASYEAWIQQGIFPIRPNLPDAEAAAKAATFEAQRLAMAELYWVDAGMTDLVRHAAGTMPQFTLMPEDLPSPYGLIVFEEPLKVIPSHDEDFDDFLYLTAAAWGPWNQSNFEHPYLWVSWYTDTGRNFATVDPRRSLGRTWREIGYAPLSYENEAVICFSEDPLPAKSTSGESADLRVGTYCLPELRAAWALMQQQIAIISNAHFDRTARRRLEKAKIEPRPVRVITLRRPKSTGQHGESDREYHHQWIVRGHWRQQWYPTRKVHRPIWIAPHIKGPEDAPLLGGEKVYSWTR